jgi:hypothetical protein
MGPILQVGGKWDIVQRNGFRVTVDVRQTENRLTAAAVSDRGVHSESAEGFVQGPNFELIIKWQGGARGRYTGVFSHGPFTPPPIGFLRGETVDMDNPQSRAGWQSEGRNFQIA